MSKLCPKISDSSALTHIFHVPLMRGLTVYTVSMVYKGSVYKGQYSDFWQNKGCVSKASTEISKLRDGFTYTPLSKLRDTSL